MSIRTYFTYKSRQDRVRNLVIYLFLAVGCATVFGPLWWMLATSLKSMQEIVTYPPTWFPQEIHFENFRLAWEQARFPRYSLNTLLLASVSVIANVTSNTFIAYGFAKIRFPGRSLLFGIVLATMMIPGAVTLVPSYILFAKIGWVGTYLPLMVPAFFGSAFNIFLCRQFYMTIPNEMIEAAKIDGANHPTIWARLMLPLAKPVAATIAIFSFNGAWNDFIGPLLYVNSEDMYTLQIGLQVFKTSEITQWNLLMAASTMVFLPVVVLFFLFQRFFIEGMNISSGVKG